ncbi:hypothetical protein [uncultured Clostridium sp.]|uniref:hypothetical protein n=1 Tax=uncultured Clostridium sp. TaxID=59620 RepID=UPI00261AEFB5|nr:hypothetical protein [uncultured Clostridium sp.]
MSVLLSRVIGEIIGLGLVCGPPVVGKLVAVTAQSIVIELNPPGFPPITPAPSGLIAYIPIDKIIGFSVITELAAP